MKIGMRTLFVLVWSGVFLVGGCGDDEPAAGGPAAGTGGASNAGAGGSAAGSAGMAGVGAAAGFAGTGGASGHAGLSGTMSCGSVPVLDDVCASCADSKCCDDGTRCAANADCLALRACVASCALNDSACEESCSTASPAGVSDHRVLDACLHHECPTECEAAAQDSCGWRASSATCQPCAQQECCDAAYDAAHTAAYWDFTTCAGQCTPDDTDCRGQCVDENPTGFTKFKLLDHCLLTACNADCADPPGTRMCGAAEHGDDTCDPCLETGCCDEWKAVGGSEDYYLLATCMWACGTTSCLQDCSREHLEGYGLWGAASACMAIECNSECSELYPNLPSCGLRRTGTSACTSCVEEHCCDELSEAALSPDTQSGIMCVSACDPDDSPCREDCYTAYPDYVYFQLRLASCEETQCAGECSEEPAICGNPLEDASNPCWNCIQSDSDCCARWSACFAAPACARIFACLILCEDGDEYCPDDCVAEYPDGASLFQESTTCVLTSCPTECG